MAPSIVVQTLSPQSVRKNITHGYAHKTIWWRWFFHLRLVFSGMSKFVSGWQKLTRRKEYHLPGLLIVCGITTHMPVKHYKFFKSILSSFCLLQCHDNNDSNSIYWLFIHCQLLTDHNNLNASKGLTQVFQIRKLLVLEFLSSTFRQLHKTPLTGQFIINRNYFSML